MDADLVLLNGKTVIPGIIDSHGHLAQSAVQLTHIDCSLDGGVKSIKDIQDRVAERAKHGRCLDNHPNGKFARSLHHCYSLNLYEEIIEE